MRKKKEEPLNPYCLKCKNDCKQMAIIKIIRCPNYQPLITEERTEVQ